ncbi:O-antigen ligase family protein [Candidatus Omnitrophota bacterium]
MAALISSFMITTTPDLSKSVMIVVSIALIVATFIDTNIGLIAILLSMLLSPELEIGSTAGKDIVVRAEDLLLIIVSLTWLAKMAIRKELPVLRKSPLNAPIGLYIAALCVSTLVSVLTGNVTPLKGMFYVLKLIEYFILYFIVLNHTTTIKQVKLFLAVLIITAIIVGIYGNTHIGGVARISAPFEGQGEPNTLGGYLLFIMAIIGGLIFYYKRREKLLFFIFLFLVPTFIFTLSRSAYLGMIPALITFMLLSKSRGVTVTVTTLLLIFVFFISVGPPVLKDRVLGAFRPTDYQEVRGIGPITLGPSPAARLVSWRNVITKHFPRRPLLGFGVTGGVFLDSQYVLALHETGLIGFMLFIWLMWRVWMAALRAFYEVERPLLKGLALGYAAGFVGLLFHAIGSNTFVIIRIAEPFWFFTAVIVKLTDIETGKAQMEDMVPRIHRYRR